MSRVCIRISIDTSDTFEVEVYFMERGKQKIGVRRMSAEEKEELVRVCKDWEKGTSSLSLLFSSLNCNAVVYTDHSWARGPLWQQRVL
jgi:hypothetical protein